MTPPAWEDRGRKASSSMSDTVPESTSTSQVLPAQGCTPSPRASQLTIAGCSVHSNTRQYSQGKKKKHACMHHNENKFPVAWFASNISTGRELSFYLYGIFYFLLLRERMILSIWFLVMFSNDMKWGLFTSYCKESPEVYRNFPFISIFWPLIRRNIVY